MLLVDQVGTQEFGKGAPTPLLTLGIFLRVYGYPFSPWIWGKKCTIVHQVGVGVQWMGDHFAQSRHIINDKVKN